MSSDAVATTKHDAILLFLKEARRVRKRAAQQSLFRGQVMASRPHRSYTLRQVFWRVGLTVALVSMVGWVWRQTPSVIGFLDLVDSALGYGLIAGVLALVVYGLRPLGACVWVGVRDRQRLARSVWSDYPTRQRMLSSVALTGALCGLFYGVLWALNAVWKAHEGLIPWVSGQPIWHAGAVMIGIGVLLTPLWPYVLTKQRASVPVERVRYAHEGLRRTKSEGSGVWLGTSTGQLVQHGHRSGCAPAQAIVLSWQEMAQNVLVLGGIGSGKTTGVMQPLLAQLLEQECGGWVFDIKGDVGPVLAQLAQASDRTVLTVGPLHTAMNIIAGLSPEVAASFLKSALLVSGRGHSDGFWIDTATELCRHTLGVLLCVPTHYTLQGVYQYLFDPQQRQVMRAQAQAQQAALAPSAQRAWAACEHYHDRVFATFDEKVQSGVRATLTQVLSPFNHPELVDAFCSPSGGAPKLEALLDGALFLVDMPLAQWGLGAKVAYMFLKLRFFNLMQQRVHHPEWNQARQVFFMCDEYQEIISASQAGLSDVTFWDKSRSSRTLGIISTQSVSSVYAALGNQDLAQAVLQNFRQKVCLRTEDTATLSWMHQMAGQALVARQTQGHSQGHSGGALGVRGSHHRAWQQSRTEQREAVLDAALFRGLAPEHAVALLTIHGQSMDDVLTLNPLYL